MEHMEDRTIDPSLLLHTHIGEKRRVWVTLAVKWDFLFHYFIEQSKFDSPKFQLTVFGDFFLWLLYILFSLNST